MVKNQALCKQPKDSVHRVKAPCSPGYEGKWCRYSYWTNPCRDGGIGVSFYYFDTKEEASEGMLEKNRGVK